MVISTETKKETQLPNGGFAVALGYFDGVHIGHRELFSCLDRVREGREKAVFTFFPENGDKLFKNAKVLTSFEEKLSLFAELGIKYVFAYRFSEISHLSGEEFVSKILISDCRAERVVTGDNFRFGHKASCGIAELDAYLKGYSSALTVADTVMYEGLPVSSTRIRGLLEMGDIEKANCLLGRRYTLSGAVSHGRGEGKGLGFATANMPFSYGAIVPRRGVYASAAIVGGAVYPAITNIGVCPTFEKDGCERAETHILDYKGDLYGKTLSVELVCFIREEMRFSSKEALISQVERDIEAVRTLAATPMPLI